MITTPTDPKADSYATIQQAEDFLLSYKRFDTWDNLSDTKKEGYLKRATREIDMFSFYALPFYYFSTDFRPEQFLSFPLQDSSSRVVYANSSGNLSTIPVNNLEFSETLNDDTYQDGGLVVTQGDARGETYRITLVDTKAGTVTIDGTVTLNGDEPLRLIERIPFEIEYATIEQAYHLATTPENPYVDRGVKSEKIGDVSVTYEKPETTKFKGIEFSLACINYLEPFLRRVWTM